MSFIHLHRGLRVKRPRVALMAAVAAESSTATKLLFTTQPAGSTSGTALTTAPVVKAVNPSNVTDTAKTGTVTLTLNVLTGSPVLSGTATKALSSGVADFAANGLTVTGAGTWTLTATLSGLSSATSNAVETTVPANAAPDQPTISAGSLTSSGATLTGSAFSDSDVGDTHAASQWQVTTTADTGFASPVISTGDDATNKTSYAATGLSASTGYIARVRYKDSAGNYSAWSTSASFTTSAGFTTITDSFTAADGTNLAGRTTDTGSKVWINVTGALQILGNQAAPNATGLGTMVVIDTGVSDGTFGFTVGVGSSRYSALAFRVVDASNYWRVERDTTNLYMYKVAAGSQTQPGGAGVATVAGDVVAVTCSGNTIQIYVNGVAKGSLVTDSFNATATKAGLYLSAANTTARWDDFSVTVP